MGDPQTATSYEVIGKLADGDVAELFLAKATGPLERLVVVKRIPRKVTQNVDLVKMFLEEAQVAARLQHPNIAQVFEVGKLGGSYFFSMEYINGETLRALVEHARAKKIQVPIRSIVTIAAGAVAGLHHAHQRAGLDGKPLGIVHADVSPTNLLVSREGIVKLVDFGIAKARGRSHLQTPVAKISYWSPEQCRGETLDRRSDLFSLGVVLWELITLEDLFHRGGDAKTRAAIENEEAPAPSARRYDVPPELDVIILRLLAKKPDDRFNDADEVLAALEGLASKLGFQLSTAELARMMRLWFGNVPDPAIAPTDTPLVVKSEPVPTDLATAPAADPIDALLDTVRNATEVIRAAAAVLGTAPRADKSTAAPVLSAGVDSTREDFAQVRDRILAQARKKKETLRPPLSADGAAAAGVAAAATAASTDVAAAPTPASDAPSTATRPKRETLNSANNAYSFITNVSGKAAEPTRKMGITSTPPMGTAATDAAVSDAIVASQAAMAAATTAAGKNGAADTATTDVDGAKTAAASASATAKATDVDGATTAAASADAAKATDVDGATTAAASADAAKATDVDGAKTAAASADVAKASDAKTAAASADAAKASDADAKSAAASADAAKASDADAKPATADGDAKGDTDAKADAKADTKAGADATAKDAAREAPRASEPRAVAARTAVAREPSESDAEAVPPGRPGWMVPAGLAAAAVLVIVILFAMKGGDDKPTRSTEQQNQQQVAALADARDVAPVVTPADAAEPIAVVTPDAAEVAAVPPDAADVAVVPADAATQVAMATPDAAVQAPKDPVDKPKDTASTKPKDTADKPKDTADKPKDTADKPKDPPAAAKTIEELVAGGDFAKANKACKTNTIFNSARLTACTIAACNVKDAALAKRWIRAISKAERPELIKTCDAMGVAIEDPSAPPAP